MNSVLPNLYVKVFSDVRSQLLLAKREKERERKGEREKTTVC